MAVPKSLAPNADSDTAGSTLTIPDHAGGIDHLHHYFEHTADRWPRATALVCGPTDLCYADLDEAANQLAHLLRQRGSAEGSTVGILLDRSVDTYVALLGVLKSGAAYVPLDPSFPADRLAYIARDANLCDLVTTSATAAQRGELPCAVLELDRVRTELAQQSTQRPELDLDPAAPAYVIYTSGSTGTPKGVAVSHASIANFLAVATPIYGVTSEDRVYQGMSISFDFHLEEMWPAWVAGATLVAGPTDTRRFGQGLTEFLTEHRVTVFCSVPTLLTTIEQDPPAVRCLLVSGESMPADLVRRWARPGRRILNCYGPTEATVSASCRELLPDLPVTLGTPFPTYRFYVLDEQLREVAAGAVGEICIGGPGVAIGYLNRPDLTAERFVDNPITRDRAEVPRVYRTGDLGRLTASGEYEYLGRMDNQVKIRGYRIELGEIEQLLREDDAVENAVVTTLERDGVAQDLIGYVTLHHNGNGTGNGRHNGHGTGNGDGNGDGAQELRDRLHRTLRRRLAPYMIPAFIEVLDRFPLLAADKVNRAALPPPSSPPLGARTGPHVPADTPTEHTLASVVGEVLGIPEVSADADFFCELGGHSLAAARVISALRERQPDLAGLAMGDMYANPTVRGLARYADTELATATSTALDTPDWPATLKHSTFRFVRCGLAQLALLYCWLLVLGIPGLVFVYAVQLKFKIWSLDLPATGPFQILNQVGLVPVALVCVAWFSVELFALPIVVSRLLVRGLSPGWHPLWGWAYLRFWFAGRVYALAPIVLLTSTPLLPRYLRLLGARIGRDCHLATQFVSLPRFVEIGDDVSLGSLTRIEPYTVQGGWLHIAPVRVGNGVFVDANTVVMAGAQIGAGASVGHQSLVHAGQRIPAGEHWIGSPSRRVAAQPQLVRAMAERLDDGRWRPGIVAGYLLGTTALRFFPFVMLVPSLLLAVWAAKQGGLRLAALSVLVGGPFEVLAACLTLIILKRAISRRIPPGIYPWRSGTGLRMWLSAHLLQMTVGMLATIYCTLYVIPFLRGMGMRLGRWSEVATPALIDPDVSIIGDKSFLAGGVTIASPVYHNGYIGVASAEMERFSFLGNEAMLPGGTRMSERSLLGVLSVPPDKPVGPETTWLGSPSFFLPRRQESQKFAAKYIDTPTPGLIIGRLAIEFVRLVLPEMIMLLGGMLMFYGMDVIGGNLSDWALLFLLPLLSWAVAFANTAQVIVLKWLIMGRYRPRTEPYWGLWVRGTEFITGLTQTVVTRSWLGQFWGTPWAAPILRLMGTKIGKRVYLNTSPTEFDLVEIGDDVMLNEHCDLQTHLFEDRVMKMSRVRVEDGATVGARAVVLYDAVVGAGTHLDSYSLVMKGEVLPPHTRWRGLPARPM